MRVATIGAIAALGAIAVFSGSVSPTAAAPVGAAQSDMARVAANESAQGAGDVVEVKKGRGPRAGRRHHGRSHHRGRRHYRGRRYRSGPSWYYWAPWVGTYLYFESYDSCYRSCRRRGNSRSYCRDVCAW